MAMWHDVNVLAKAKALGRAAMMPNALFILADACIQHNEI